MLVPGSGDARSDHLWIMRCVNAAHDPVPGSGTPLEATGRLLELHGVPVERHYGGTLDEMRTVRRAFHDALGDV